MEEAQVEIPRLLHVYLVDFENVASWTKIEGNIRYTES